MVRSSMCRPFVSCRAAEHDGRGAGRGPDPESMCYLI
jgi:hypothetical protein